MNLKMLRVDDDTYEELVKMGKYGDTMDDIVKRCVNAYKKVTKS